MADVLMTRDQIKEVIPHREPILMIDEVLEMVPGESIKARRYLDPAENYFKGHFPDQPILPGVLTVECMAQTADVLLLSAEKYAVDRVVIFLYRVNVFPERLVHQIQRAVPECGGFPQLAVVGKMRIQSARSQHHVTGDIHAFAHLRRRA